VQEVARLVPVWCEKKRKGKRRKGKEEREKKMQREKASGRGLALAESYSGQEI